MDWIMLDSKLIGVMGMSKTEKGVMIMKDGKGWGITREDGHSTSHGWMDAEDAPIHDPEYCTKTTDVTYKGSYLTKELLTGELVAVERTTTIKLVIGEVKQ